MPLSFRSADGHPASWADATFFVFCISIFTVASFLCGAAPTLPMLLIFRVIQGAGGGGMQPMAQAIMADSFEPHKRGQAFALYGLVAVLAPSIGPTLGGWITDNFSWRWIFFINIPVGILAFILVTRMVEDPPWIKADPQTSQHGLHGAGLPHHRHGRPPDHA